VATLWGFESLPRHQNPYDTEFSPSVIVGILRSNSVICGIFSRKIHASPLASFRKSGSGWRAEIFRHGIRRSETFETKQAATAWAGREEAKIIAGYRGEIPNLTFDDLLDRYEKEVSAHKKGYRWESVRIALLRRDPLALVRLRRMDAADAASWRDRRLQVVSAASVRREWNLLSNACNIAVREWRWLGINPFAGVRRPQGGKPRERVASTDELSILAEKPKSPAKEKAFAAFLFGVETGMRASEICGLGEIQGTVARLADTKNGTAREVPLSDRAIQIWQEFGPFGLTPAALDVHWRELTRAVGIENLHFHDSRHTAITRLSRKLSALALAKMVGIKDLRVLMIYYNETAEDIAKRL
jgi:integrase